MALVFNRVVSACLLCICLPSPASAASDKQVDGQSAAASATVMAPFTDHVELRIEKPAANVWAQLKRLYVDGERSRQYGYAVAPLANDIGAYLGGTEARNPASKERPYVRTRISALDEDAMLLSLVIDLENPVPVYVIHQVRADGPEAAVYQSIVQTMMPVQAKAGEQLSAASVAERMRAIVRTHNQEMTAILLREKDVIEKSK